MASRIGEGVPAVTPLQGDGADAVESDREHVRAERSGGEGRRVAGERKRVCRVGHARDGHQVGAAVAIDGDVAARWHKGAKHCAAARDLDGVGSGARSENDTPGGARAADRQPGGAALTGAVRLHLGQADRDRLHDGGTDRTELVGRQNRNGEGAGYGVGVGPDDRGVVSRGGYRLRAAIAPVDAVGIPARVIGCERVAGREGKSCAAGRARHRTDPRRRPWARARSG